MLRIVAVSIRKIRQSKIKLIIFFVFYYSKVTIQLITIF